MAGETEEIVKDDEIEEDLEAEHKEEDKKTDKEEVPLRKGAIKTNADFARERISLKDKKTGKEDDEDEVELTPKARKLIEQEVERRVAPLNDELNFRDYFSTHPDDRKYEKQARARFDAWGTVPIEEVMKTLRPSVNVEEKEKAVDKVTRNSMKGSSVRKGEESVASTEAEYKEIYQNIKRGETGKALKKLGIQ